MAQPIGPELDNLLAMLANNLELIFDYMDVDSKTAKQNELKQYIYASVTYIEREGITLDYSDMSDCLLVVMYSAWLYDKRKDGVAIMPRMLRYNLNNKLMSQKV